MRVYKYAIELEKINGAVKCPREDAEPQDILAFRLGYEDVNDERNFIPQSLKDKMRGKGPRKNLDRHDINKPCDYHALSMFNSLKSITYFWEEGLDEQVRTSLGYTKLMQGEVKKEDGVITPIDGKGHFNLHEYAEVDLKGRFEFLKHL